MRSPFPGMDPYLEDSSLWPQFHQSLVGRLRDDFQQRLHDYGHYRPRLQARHYVADGEHQEDYIEIVHDSDDRLITLVDVVSPANKATAAGREAFQSTWRRGNQAGANLVEIDLVLQGQPLVEYSRDGLPKWDYAVTVLRRKMPKQFEIYTSSLPKRLPRFKLPLAADERDAIVDLQAVFARCYDQGGFGARIDYQQAPSVALSDENRQLVERLFPGLKHQFELLHERVAVAAYYLWEKEGCPHGRDKVHWCEAVEQLKQSSGIG